MFQPLRAGVPARLPRPTGWRARRSPTSAGSRSSVRRDGADPQPLPAARGARRASSAASCSARAGCRCPTCCRRSSTWARRSSTSARTRSRPTAREPVWIYDFGLQIVDRRHRARSATIFQEAFLGVWRGDLEDDGLNGLVLARRPDGPPDHDPPRDRQVPAPGGDRVLRRLHGAHAAGAPEDRDAAGQAVRRPVRSRSAPTRGRRSRPAADDREGDRRRREPRRGPDPAQLPVGGRARCCAPTTSAAATAGADAGATAPSLVSFKLDSAQVPILPLPRPKFEIFVYSPRVEGVHLRGGKVARGGLRWSDRREDFRTEVLGLMKAQMVKNALIVPVGSKGGFVVKRPPRERRTRGAARGGDRLLPDVPRPGCSTSPTTSSAASA